MEKRISRDTAMQIARILTPYLTEKEIMLFIRDCAMLVAHGCKIYLTKRGPVPQWYISGYAEDGSDVDAVFAHVNKQSCKVCSFYLSH